MMAYLWGLVWTIFLTIDIGLNLWYNSQAYPPSYMVSADYHRGIEQLAARKAHNLEVPGSSPGPATKLVLHNLMKNCLGSKP